MEEPPRVSRFGSRLRTAAAKSLAAAVWLIILVAAVVAVVALHGTVEWALLGGVGAIALVSGAYEFGKSQSSDRHQSIGADPKRDLVNQTPSPALPKVEGVSPAPSRLYSLSTEAAVEECYSVLAESIRRAQAIIYRSGRGFSDEPLKRFSRDLVSAEEFALKNGVKIHRIQTADHVSKEWAERYAELVDKYPGGLFVYTDFKDPALVNIGLIDPQRPQPEIQILFESVATAGPSRHTADAAIFVYGPPTFARSLQAQFEQWISRLKILDADQVRDLARTCLYFAYGSNMSLAQMRERCPEAIRMGTGILYGWRRNFAVVAPHMGTTATAAGIERSDGDADYVEGVVYDLTGEEKKSLDEIEAGGYAPVEIDFKLSGKHVSGYTHIPIGAPAPADFRPPHDYMQRIIDGAEMNGLMDLARKLRLMDYTKNYSGDTALH